MRLNISNRDWELLSAYIDGQLSSGKREQLEARIQTTPELRAALEDLTQTRALVRSLPCLKAPHSFRLTPEMVGRSQPRRLYPFFQFASALTSLLLVMVLLSDFLGFGFPTLFGRTESQAPEAPVAAEVLVESTPESLALEMPVEEPAEARKVGSTEADQLVVTQPVEGEIVLGSPASEPSVEAEVYLAAPAAPKEEATNLSMEAVEAPLDASMAEDLPAEMPAAELQASELETEQATPADDQAISEKLSGIRILQILLAAIAFGTAMVAIYLRRMGI
jgi:hypothetical protein